MHIAFLIRSLDRGGAERQMVLLAKGLAQKGHTIEVIVFYPGGYFQKQLEDAGIRVISLDKTGRWDIFSFFLKLGRVIKALNPDILHSYLVVPNSVAVLMKPFFPGLKIVCGLRISVMDMSKYDRVNRFSYFIESIFSRMADLLIANSEAGKAIYINKGCSPKKIDVVHNGIDTRFFRSDNTAGKATRKILGISKEMIVIGMVSRIDPVKQIENFIRAAVLIKEKRTDIKYVIVGGGDVDYLTFLKGLSKKQGLDDDILWTGPVNNMPELYNSFDIFCQSSASEGFPNVVAEAMACDVPCVVTDAGDSKIIVGDLGIVVKTNDVDDLKNGLLLMVKRIEHLDRVNIGKNRSWIVDHFSLDAMVCKSEVCLKKMIGQQ